MPLSATNAVDSCHDRGYIRLTPKRSTRRGKDYPMAASATPAPGTQYGPCAEPCEHRSCECSRREAAALCRICTQRVGYGRPWYATIDNIPGAVHADCAEEPRT
jgi:hypothetical protein